MKNQLLSWIQSELLNNEPSVEKSFFHEKTTFIFNRIDEATLLRKHEIGAMTSNNYHFSHLKKLFHFKRRHLSNRLDLGI